MSDSFDGALGYFTLSGKSISVDDYGIAGAPPLIQIGMLWRAAQAGTLEDKTAPASKMVCEVLTLTALQPTDLVKARAQLAWLKTQPGLKTAFYAHDEATGKALAVRVWTSRGRMGAHKGSTPPEGAKAQAATTRVARKLRRSTCGATSLGSSDRVHKRGVGPGSRLRGPTTPRREAAPPMGTPALA